MSSEKEETKTEKKKVKKQKRRRYRTLGGRQIRGLILFGIVLILASGIAAGVQVFIQTLTDFGMRAESYATTIASRLDGDQIRRYVETGQKDDRYDLINNTFETTVSMLDVELLYVVVPTEDDLIFIWHVLGETAKTVEIDESKDYEFLQHVPYQSEEQKARMMDVIEGKETVMTVNEMSPYVDYEALVSTMAPVFDSEENKVAVLGVDIGIVGLLFSITMTVIGVLKSLFIILLVGLVIYYIVFRITVIRPIIALKKATVDLVNNLDSDKPFSVKVRTRDEIEILANSFGEMDRKLREYIKENTEITKEKERISTELTLATRIQEGMLPNVFPAFPDRSDFDIFASMTPAKEVGGDFYDFFLIDEAHLGVVMADVSGKGVPAALFMMMSMIMIRNYAMTGMSPKEVLETVNTQICQNNRMQMFVTVWFGVLDLETGKISAVNAGHEYPVVKMPEGKWELLKDKHGFVIGGIKNIRYTQYEIDLAPGSMLFVYTDGVAEATNEAEELYGTTRMLEAMNEVRDQTPSEILKAVGDSVNQFVGDAPQFDDLTMLCLVYQGNSHTS